MNTKRRHFSELNGKLNVSGRKIKYCRLKKNLSAQRLSDKLMMMGIDIHRQSIFAIESGRRTITDYELCAIAEVLGVQTNNLVEDFKKILESD